MHILIQTSNSISNKHFPSLGLNFKDSIVDGNKFKDISVFP